MEIWPPNYTLRVSNKAKYLQLKITHSHELQVIVPSKQTKKITTQVIHEFLEAKKYWIKKYLIAQPDKTLPPQINIFTQQILTINYESAARNAVKFSDNHLVIKSADQQKNNLLLKRWLKSYAKKVLLPIAEHLATITNFIPAKINIKEQKNLWGNCSSAKIINLNYKLIFLPLHLVHHVILHELTHLKHLNHSPKFWAQLQKLDPFALEHNNQLKTAHSYVPVWIY